jgi:transcriptional regulator, araC family
MENIVKMENVFEYCDWLGVETRHPLVEVVDFSKIDRPLERFLHTFGFYAVFLKDIKCGDLVYGRQYYDYQEGTLVFAAPGQVFGVKGGAPVKPKGWALVFHPDLLRRTSLGREMKNYTFFSYEVNEALHLSEQERGIVIDCLKKIDNELQHAVDRHSKTLIAMNIELLLDYCARFYERQFITRSEANNDILVRFENLLNDYFESDKPQTVGLPSVRWCADALHLSANYFGDLIKRETGRSAQEHIQQKLIDIAKVRIFDTGKSVSEIAYGLGFKYPQHFTRLFKKATGSTPNEYRTLN